MWGGRRFMKLDIATKSSFFLLLTCLHVSCSQNDNTTVTNCSMPVDWDQVNTTNYTDLDILFEQCLATVSQYEECPDPSLCEDTRSENENVGLAFGLTIAAGLATTVGSLIPFIPCIKRADTKYLTVSLALAAGVMLYVSFTEIFIKSQDQFCCVSTVHHNLLTTVCFFIGIALTVGLDLLVKLLEKVDCDCCKWTFRVRKIHHRDVVMLEASPSLTPSCNALQAVSPLNCNGGTVQFEENSTEHYSSNIDNDGGTFPQLSSITNEPSLTDRNEFIMDNDGMTYTPNIERASISAASNTISATTNNLGDASIQDLLSNTSIHRLHAVLGSESVSVMNEDQSHISVSLNEDGMSVRTQSLPNGGGVGGGLGGDTQSRVLSAQQPRRNSDNDTEGEEVGEEDIHVDHARRDHAHGRDHTCGGDHAHPHSSPPGEIPSPEETTDSDNNQLKEITHVIHGKDTKRLRRMGVLTGLAIALHNFPEGLATFIATLSDPSLGAALAIAIALHNIPEGVCVAMPIYYATGSRVKAFFWAFLSGVSEPIGALLGWVALRSFFGPIVYGISFGIIAGMMVYISLKELLPTAQKFDKTNGILVTLFLVVGMIVMALSLVLFYY